MPTIKITFDRAAVVSGIEKWTNYPVGSVYNTEAASMPERPYLVCGASAGDLSSIKYKEITAAELYVYVYTVIGTAHTDIQLYNISEPFVESEVTYASLRWGGYAARSIYTPDNSWSSITFYTHNHAEIRSAIENGLIFALYGSIESPKGTKKPYFELTYGGDNVGVTVHQSYPTGSATISKSIDTSFSWDVYPATHATIEPVAAKSAVLRWRYLGASTYTEVSCESPTKCTIPANTFSEGTVQWQVVVTANSGVVTTSDWMTTEVKEPVSSAVASYPVNTVLDGSTEQTFLWEHIISNGTAQRAFDLQTSPDGSSWSTIRQVETNLTSATFAPGTFDAGDLWWRVRTYNLAGTAGAWSEPVHCIVIAAPEAPSITADDTSPKFVLRWQQSGQQAYELMVDGVVIAKTFSAESIYRHTGYLEPGTGPRPEQVSNVVGVGNRKSTD